MKNPRTAKLAQGAVIAALYVALTIVFAPISFREIQVRIAEALTILPLFSGAAVPGLFIGCLLANFIGGAAVPDIIFGSLATLIGAIGTRMLRNRKPVLGTIPPILSNTVIIPFILRYAYSVELPIPILMLSLFIGEVLSCGVLGMILYYALNRRRKAIFKNEEE